MSAPEITFIGTGLMIFVRNTLDDVLHYRALETTHIAPMDTDPTRLEESYIVVYELMDSAGANDKVTCHTQQKEALQDTDFMVVALQTGGYEPCTVTDSGVCKQYGLEQTIADTLGSGGIMRVPRTTPHLWQTYEDMMEVCLDVTMLNYANPMVMNARTMRVRYPHIKRVGPCHSVQGTTEELACDLNIDPVALRYRYTGINHMAFYLELERRTADGSYTNLYPELLAVYKTRQAPKPNTHGNTRYQNIMRCEMFKELGYFVAGSLEHFAECTPWSIEPGREGLIERYKVPLDEYPKRCVEQLANWHEGLEEYRNASRIDIKPSRECANTIMNAIWTDEPSVTYGNVRNDGLIDSLPQGCCVEVTYLVDANGIQPTKIGTLPLRLAALMQTNINAQTLLTEAILTENRDRVYRATIMDPHITAVLGIDEIYTFADDLVATHDDWLFGWLHR